MKGKHVIIVASYDQPAERSLCNAFGVFINVHIASLTLGVSSALEICIVLCIKCMVRVAHFLTIKIIIKEQLYPSIVRYLWCLLSIIFFLILDHSSVKCMNHMQAVGHSIVFLFCSDNFNNCGIFLITASLIILFLTTHNMNVGHVGQRTCSFGKIKIFF